MVSDIILLLLSHICQSAFGNRVCGKCFSKKNISLAFDETFPTMTACSKLMSSLHLICLVHGLEVRKPEMVVQSLMNVIERIIVDMPEEYLLFLQDAFPYFEKYLVTDYLPKLVERIAFVMEQHKLNTSRDKAWKKPELAQKYKEKYLEANTNKLKIAP